jgi:hypothetical protein
MTNEEAILFCHLPLVIGHLLFPLEAPLDPLHLTIALAPVAVYLLLIGLLNLSSRPFVTTGLRDSAALGVALMGFVIVGPMELFLPERLLARLPLPWLVWPILISFYLLCLTLLVLLQRPRLVVYNITSEQLRASLGDILGQLDKEARIAGESICLPNLGVQLYIESLPVLKNVQLKSTGPLQSYHGWRELEAALRAALRDSRGTANPYGVSLILLGAAILGIVGYLMTFDGEAIAQAWLEMIRSPQE